MNDYYADLPALENGEHTFSKREHQVVALLAAGYPRQIIGEHLEMRPKNVSICIRRSMRKNGAGSEKELIRLYKEVMPHK